MSDRIRRIVMTLIEELFTGATDAEWHEALQQDETEPREYETGVIA